MVVACVVAAAAFAVIAVKAVPELADASARATSAAAVAPPAPASAGRPAGGYKVAIASDRSGHYLTTAVVNGHTVDVVIDTGATLVSLTADTARRLGVRLAPGDYTREVTTANGVVAAAEVTLSEIQLGAIRVENVEALVVPGDGLGVNLLGMNFLNRLTRFEAAGGQLVLTD